MLNFLTQVNFQLNGFCPGNIFFLNKSFFHKDTETQLLQSAVLREAFKQTGKHFLFFQTVSIGKEMPSSKEVHTYCLSYIANQKCFQATCIPVGFNF